MTNIALKELLPASFKYDPCNQVTTKGLLGQLFLLLLLRHIVSLYYNREGALIFYIICLVLGGMILMAFSLVLFEFQ